MFTRSVESGTALDFDVVVKNRSIEWDLDVARRVLSSLISFFEDGAGELNRSVRLTIHTPEPVTLQSTYAREVRAASCGSKKLKDASNSYILSSCTLYTTTRSYA